MGVYASEARTGSRDSDEQSSSSHRHDDRLHNSPEASQAIPEYLRTMRPEQDDQEEEYQNGIGVSEISPLARDHLLEADSYSRYPTTLTAEHETETGHFDLQSVLEQGQIPSRTDSGASDTRDSRDGLTRQFDELAQSENHDSLPSQSFTDWQRALRDARTIPDRAPSHRETPRREGRFGQDLSERSDSERIEEEDTGSREADEGEEQSAAEDQAAQAQESEADSEEQESGTELGEDAEAESGDGVPNETGGGGAPGESGSDEAEILDDLETGEALVDFELAEHERWAGSFGEMGTAGSDQRAQFILDQAGQGATSGATGALGMGFVMGAIGAGVGQIAGRRLATLAVSRGFAATPVPGLGSAIGGVMAVAGLAMRDWGATAETIGRMGEGEGYEGLANDLEGLAEILDIATQVMDVLAGVLGGIAVGMWVAAVLSAGTLSPLAASLSAIALGINAATTAIGILISVVIRPVVVALRALHTFESQGDPAQIEAEGQQLQSAAGQITGAVAGAAAGRLGGAAGTRGGTRVDTGISRIQAGRTGGSPSMSARGSGPRIHAEVPEAPSSSSSGAGGTLASAAGAGSGSGGPARPASTTGPAAAAPSSRRRPRASSQRDVSERTHSAELRERRTRAEEYTGVEFTREETRSLDIRDVMAETISQRTSTSPTGALDAEFGAIPARDNQPRLRAGHERGWSHPDRATQRRVESSLRTEASTASRRQVVEAEADGSQHTRRTMETMDHLSADQRATLMEPPVSRRMADRMRSEGDVPPPGHLPEGWQTHHLETVRDSPSTAHRGDVTVTVPGQVHREAGHGNDYRAPVETGSARDPDAATRPAFHMDREAQPRTRATHDEIARGSRSSGDLDTDIGLQYGTRQDPASRRYIQRQLAQHETALSRARQLQSESPTPARARRIEQLEAQIDGTRRFLEDPSSAASTAGSSTSSGGPAASSPARSPSPASGPTSAHASHTETARTTDRSAAMEQYHQQIAADPGRESGVWRGEDGTFYVMQGDSGSVAPPAGAGRAELIYHSHPTSSDAGYQGMVSQPSQAGGDFGVLQFQHGQGTPGRRQSSELHFPVYDDAGNHAGYGATQFAYDPTHPLPLQVQTTMPGGRPTTQRYASHADFEARTGIGASGSTPSATRSTADAQLQTDVAAARSRIDAIAGGTRTRPYGLPGMSLGAELGRQEVHEDVDAAIDGELLVEGESAEGGTGRPQYGPAYTASIDGLEPGASFEIPINPAYPEPPGTPAELAVLMERVHAAQAAQEDLSETEESMQGQAAEQQTHATQLGEAQVVTQDLTTGRQAHQGQVDATQSTNTEQQSTAGEAISNLGQAAEQQAALATLTGSLRVFQGLAHLFSYLPGDLGRSAEGAKEDAGSLITSLNRVSETEATESNIETGRSGMEANEERITSVATDGQQTDEELAAGEAGVVELQQANAQSLTETLSVLGQANRERSAAEEIEDEAQSTHDSLDSSLQAWAQEHQQAREDAIASAMAQYSEQGYEVREE